MEVKVDLEKICAILTPTEQATIHLILSQLNPLEDDVRQKVNFADLCKEMSMTRTMITGVIKSMALLGVIEAKGLGPRGTLITVCNAQACEYLKEKCKVYAI